MFHDRAGVSNAMEAEGAGRLCLPRRSLVEILRLDFEEAVRELQSALYPSAA